MMMTSWAIVCDVWYLPPTTRQPNESAIDFANRVKASIASAGGLVDLMWSVVGGGRSVLDQRAMKESLGCLDGVLDGVGGMDCYPAWSKVSGCLLFLLRSRWVGHWSVVDVQLLT